MIHSQKTIESIINVYMVFHRCSVFFYRQQGVYKIVWLLTFLTTLIVYSIKKFHETYWCCSSKERKKKRTDWILNRIFNLHDKNPLYLPIILTLQYLWGSKWSASNSIGHKTVSHIPNIKNSEFKLKKCQVFPNLLLFFIYFFRQYLNNLCEIF